MECSIFKKHVDTLTLKLEDKFKRTGCKDNMMVTLILVNLLSSCQMFNPTRYFLCCECSNTSRFKCLCPEVFRILFSSRSSINTYLYLYCGQSPCSSTNSSLLDSSSSAMQNVTHCCLM